MPLGLIFLIVLLVGSMLFLDVNDNPRNPFKP